MIFITPFKYLNTPEKTILYEQYADFIVFCFPYYIENESIDEF